MTEYIKKDDIVQCINDVETELIKNCKTTLFSELVKSIIGIVKCSILRMMGTESEDIDG